MFRADDAAVATSRLLLFLCFPTCSAAQPDPASRFPKPTKQTSTSKKKGCYLVKSLNRSHFNFILIFCIDLPRAAAAAAVVEVSSKSSLEEREDATSIRDGHFGFDGVGVGW